MATSIWRQEGTPWHQNQNTARLAFVFGKESRILQPVSPVPVAFSAFLLTSVVLLAVDSFIDIEALAFIYLLPVIVMAMHYGSTIGVLTSFTSALAAAYSAFLRNSAFIFLIRSMSRSWDSFCCSR